MQALISSCGISFQIWTRVYDNSSRQIVLPNFIIYEPLYSPQFYKVQIRSQDIAGCRRSLIEFSIKNSRVVAAVCGCVLSCIRKKLLPHIAPLSFLVLAEQWDRCVDSRWFLSISLQSHRWITHLLLEQYFVISVDAKLEFIYRNWINKITIHRWKARFSIFSLSSEHKLAF